MTLVDSAIPLVSILAATPFIQAEQPTKSLVSIDASSPHVTLAGGLAEIHILLSLLMVALQLHAPAEA